MQTNSIILIHNSITPHLNFQKKAELRGYKISKKSHK